MDHVTFGYQGHDVIRNATFEVNTGDFASIVGPNGSGKTTLLKLILGLLAPRSGKVHVLEKDAYEDWLANEREALYSNGSDI